MKNTRPSQLPTARKDSWSRFATRPAPGTPIFRVLEAARRRFGGAKKVRSFRSLLIARNRSGAVHPRVPVEVSTKNNVLETHLSSAFSPGRDACRGTRDNLLVPTDFPVQYQSRGDIDYRGLDVAGELNVTDNTNYWESRSTLPSAPASF